jgi:hypothetical protein
MASWERTDAEFGAEFSYSDVNKFGVAKLGCENLGKLSWISVVHSDDVVIATELN